jgi:hypothetical protein
MLPKVFFDKTAFVKIKTSNNILQNIDDTDLKQPKIHRKICTSLWILKKKKICEPIVSRFLPYLWDF